ncbi:MAG: phage holin, lambda family, partial [Candidatus Oceanisphaera merdipullorum]|nr:phage holin, lambda family [Candidatus Oceanisphaera merdipullorum]
CGLFYSPCGVTDMPVPHKDPSLWAMLAAWLAHHSPTLYGFFLAVAVAIVRVIYGGGSVRQMILEGTLCGLLSLTLTSGLELAGLPVSASSFVGGLVGFVGTAAARDFAMKWLGKKVGG